MANATGASLAAVLRELAPKCHQRRAELLEAVAGELENKRSDAMRLLASIAAGPRAPAKLPAPRTFLAFLDTGHLFPSSEEAAKAKPRNRAVAKRLFEIAGNGNDAPARIARCLAFSFSDRGYGTFHMLRFACGLEPCFRDPFHFEGFGEEFGPVVGPCVRSHEELGTYLAYFMRSAEFDAGEIARTVWHGTRALGVFADATYEDMVETLDAWLCKKAPSAEPREAAAGVLRILGMPAAEAKRIMASVPVQPNGKVPKQEAPANKPIEIRESKNVQRYALPTNASRFADPWMKKMAQRTAREVCTELAARWADVPSWLKPLRTSIVQGEILGLSTGPAGTFVEIRAKGGQSLRYVPSPGPRAAVEKGLSALGVSEDDPLRELVIFFDGLRDAPPDHAGGLVPVAQMTRAGRERRRRSSMLSLIETEELRGWTDAVVVYEEANGDLLLADPRGRIGWARHEEGCVEPCGRTMKDFVRSHFG